MPLYTDIFGRLDWLTKKVKALLGTARHYKVYTVLLQKPNSGDNNPELMQELENTLGGGTPTFARESDAVYTIDFPVDCLVVGRTFVTVNMWGDDLGTPLGGSGAHFGDPKQIRFGNGNGYDAFNYCSVEIRVYN